MRRFWRRSPTPEVGHRGLASQAKPRYNLRMKHSPGFLVIVEDAKSRVKEISIDDARARLAENPDTVLLDVREESEWTRAHAKEAQYLGKGVLERDLETRFVDKETEIIMYCGGGYRSALTCDVAQKMGYTNVKSLANGYTGMVAADWPMAVN
jgi:rhodanese-related sulfurtransferase